MLFQENVMPAACFMFCFVAGAFLTVTKLWADHTLTLQFLVTFRTE